MQYKYLISAIMPVYNSALYLGEAIDSIVNQSIGFDKIQLIIVNDGSTDNSAEVIKSYASKHSNIIFIDKENGGVASARNEGLKYVEGKYVSFPDPDDTLSLNTYMDVVSFFEKNYDSTSVVSFPIYFFGSMQGAHSLNTKFEGESRVIDLLKENEFQLHITSSLIKSEIARKIHFKSELVASEDAEALLRILIDTPKLGVVGSARYNYRKHDGSLIGTAPRKKGWYFDHITHYFNSILDYAERVNSSVPRFVQSALMYDLSWKLSQRCAPDCLSKNEIEDFENAFYSCISRLSDEVILAFQNLPEATRYHLLSKKYSSAPKILYDDILLANDKLCLSFCPCAIEFVEECGSKIKILARISIPVDFPRIEQGKLYVNGQRILASSLEYEKRTSFLGKEIVSSIMLDFELEGGSLAERSIIYLALCSGGADITLSNISFGKFCPLERKYKESFVSLGGHVVTYHENAIIIEACDKKKIKKHQRALEKEIWASNGFAERKAVVARILARIYKLFHKKPIWMLSDRLAKAGDNGEALFLHLKKTKFKDAHVLFAIRKGKDYSRLRGYGGVVDRASLKYKILFLASDLIVSSHAEDFVINPFDYYWHPYKDILAKKKFVFLQHGVTKDDLSSWLNKYNKNIKGFVTSSFAEHESILENKKYHYTENELWLCGLARFDSLDSKAERVISIMPTWRKYLAGSIDISTGEWKNSEALKNSEYIKFWNSFLGDKRLSEALEKYNYKILFVPHPNMTNMHELIKTSDKVSISYGLSYKDIYKKSSLIVTDYSSTVFDFAYMGGSVIYAQFDKDEFFSGAHSYKKGYFDYERDGFGEVTYTLDEAIDAVIRALEHNCESEQKYKHRVDNFFAYRDKNNCARITEKLIELGAKND